MAEAFTLLQTGQFQLDLQWDAATRSLVFRPIGPLNEDVNLTPTIASVRDFSPVRLMIDFSGIGAINSCGVREWVRFLELTQPTMPIAFLKVNEGTVELANIVPALLGKPGTPVLEFEVPYYCEKCQHRAGHWFKADDVPLEGSTGTHRAPPRPCPACGAETSLDGLDEEYFQFLPRSKGQG